MANQVNNGVFCPICGRGDFSFFLAKDELWGRAVNTGEGMEYKEVAKASEMGDLISYSQIYQCNNCKHTMVLSYEIETAGDLSVASAHHDFEQMLNRGELRNIMLDDMESLNKEIAYLKTIAAEGFAGVRVTQFLHECTLKAVGIDRDNIRFCLPEGYEEIFNGYLEEARKHVEQEMECARCGKGCPYPLWCEDDEQEG